LQHRLVQTTNLPLLAQFRFDQRIDFRTPGMDAADNVIEKALLGLGIDGILNFSAQPVRMKFIEQSGKADILHVHLI